MPASVEKLDAFASVRQSVRSGVQRCGGRHRDRLLRKNSTLRLVRAFSVVSKFRSLQDQRPAGLNDEGSRRRGDDGFEHAGHAVSSCGLGVAAAAGDRSGANK